MGYIALYRKYRPQVFEDVVEQRTVVKILQEALKQNKIAHAYLFAGPKGTGKTSIARIFAKGLNCVNGPTPHPCMKCEQCLTITNGTNLDVIEIDAASNRGIDEIRDLKEKVQYAPVSARYKVYIIDEAHMLTMQAFNALLKTLEEPPENVVFILATTEPEKIPATIVSRCERFYFRPISLNGLFKKIIEISQKENVKITEPAAMLIARFSSGSLRNALSLLDQAITTFSDITEEKIRELIGVPGDDILIELFLSIVKKDPVRALAVIKKMKDSGKDSKVFVNEFLNYLQDLLNVKIIGAVSKDSTFDEAFNENLKKQAKYASIKQIVNISLEFSSALNSIKLFPDPFFAVELTALKCMDLDVVSESVGSSFVKPSEKITEAKGVSEETVVGKEKTRSTLEQENAKEYGVKAIKSRSEKVTYKDKRVGNVPAPAAIEQPGVSSDSLDAIMERWDSVIAEVGKVDKPLFAMLERVHPVKFENGLLTLYSEKKFYLHMLNTEEKISILRDALKKVFHSDIRIKYTEGESDENKKPNEEVNELKISITEEVKKNKHVEEILTLFDGTISEVKKIDEEDNNEKH